MDEAKKNAFFKDWKDAPTDPAKAVAFQNGWYKGFDAGLAAKQLEYDRAWNNAKFKLGDRVRKIKGSSWQGKVCGFYVNETLGHNGYCVESEREPGSIQIYPEVALEIHDPIAETDGQSLLCFKCESLEAQLAQAIDYCDSLQREEAVREATRTANDIEQTADIRTAAEALVAALTKEPDDSDGLVYYEYSKELTNLQAALSRGWLARQEDARR